MGRSSKSTFFHQRALKLWGSQDHPKFPLIIQEPAENLAFFYSFRKVLTLFASLDRMLGIALQSKHSLFQTFPWEFLLHENACFVGLFFLEDKMSISELFHHKKLPTSY